jgi:hypothetical protein
MTGCRWPDNKKSLEDNQKTTSVSTICSFVAIVRTTHFRLFTRSLAIFFSGVDIRTAVRSQIRPRTES